MMKNRILAWALALGLLVGAVPGTLAADSFGDIEGHWAQEDIETVVGLGLFTGTTDSTFSPEGQMSRAMYVTVFGRLYEREGGSTGNALADYTDVPADAYYAKYVAWATEAEIIDGYGDNRFGPDDPVTREQMAAILYRYALYTEATEPFDPDSGVFDAPLAGTQDVVFVSDWAYTAMSWSYDNRYIQGIEFGGLAPQNASTRAQVATILCRYIADGFRHEWYNQVPPQYTTTFKSWVNTEADDWVYLQIEIENPSATDYLLKVQYEEEGGSILSETVAAGKTETFLVKIEGGPKTSAAITMSARDGSAITGHIRIVTAVTMAIPA